jgi:putative ABC transport system permease protein
MDRIRGLLRWIATFFRRRRFEAELDEELATHLEMATAENLRRGMDPDQARRSAGRDFGGVERTREQVRESGTVLRLEMVLRDIRFAIRTLLKAPGFSGVAVLTIALGIGAGATIFTVVDSVLLEPLPYPDSNQLLTVSTRWLDDPDGLRDFLALPDVDDLRNQVQSLESLIGYNQANTVLTGVGEPELIEVTQVTGGLLSVFSLTPVLGRDLGASVSGPNPDRIAVISDGFWRDRFARADDVLGQTIELAGVVCEIVGVAPAAFSYPGNTQVWIPYRTPASIYNRRTHSVQTIGRLVPEATLATARAEVAVVATALASAYPESNNRKGFLVESLRDRVVFQVRPTLWLIMGAVVVVCMIACANVTTLLLVRLSRRRGEIAVRASLGASRGRLIQQILIEGSLLAVAGSGVGVILAAGGIGIIRLISTGIIPRVETLAVDGSTLLFAAGLIMVLVLLIGLGSAHQLSHLSPGGGLLRADRHLVGSGRRFRRALIFCEVALSVVLMTGAALLLRSFNELSTLEPGFETSATLRFTLVVDGELEKIRSFYRTLEERIAALPGVESVGSIFGAPLGPGHTTAELSFPGRAAPEPGEESLAGIRAVSPHYLETARIPLIVGRTLRPEDDVAALPVAVVNQTFARRNFPGEDPLGKQVRVNMSRRFGSPVWTIVGVVGDIRSESLVREPIAEIYVPHGLFGPGYMTVTVRYASETRSLLTAVRSEVHALDPTLPLRFTETIADAVKEELRLKRFVTLLSTLFALIALILSAIGLHGVLAYLVSHRTREIGLRAALGARRGQIIRLIIIDGLGLMILGTLVGLVLSLWTGRIMASLLFQISPWDPPAFIMAVTALLLSGLAAFYMPARRASRVDPMRALRLE